jgi:hypothetical protein
VSAATLERALGESGVGGTVEARGPLAILTLPHDHVIDETLRATLVALAPAHGFTHIALEITDDADDRAALHRH